MIHTTIKQTEKSTTVKNRDVSFHFLKKKSAPQISFFHWPHLAVCRILVPQPGVKPMPPALGAQHLTTVSPGKFLHIPHLPPTPATSSSL